MPASRERSPAAPRVSAEPSRTFCFSLIVFLSGAHNKKNVKQNVLRDIAAAKRRLATGRLPAAGRERLDFLEIFDKIRKVGSRTFKDRASSEI